MYRIVCVTPHPVVAFAADELKKYLKMMMPRRGEIAVCLRPDEAENPEGKSGNGAFGAVTGMDVFRLGILSDFGLDPCRVEDDRLDDVLYADADEHGGIIAGNNPRSVLLSVYRYLKENGCRFLFPGRDGEVIPTRQVGKTSYCLRPDFRYRGQCNEGTENQRIMLDAIDFTPKLGMNTFMLEFDVPMGYYKKYYDHEYDPGMEPEKLTHEEVLQWKRACEAEIAKRGLLFHDMGHGWTVEPFGVSGEGGWTPVDESVVPKESIEYFAEINGRRGLLGGVPLNTNVCLSNAEARHIMSDAIVRYAEEQNNVDFLHVWLADGENNHCECENCRRLPPSDWYMILLNEVDAKLTARGLDTHIVFIAYVDTFWPPVQEKLVNPRRFTMLFAPIFRDYTCSYDLPADRSAIVPYVRNKTVRPKDVAGHLAYLEDWKKVFSGDCFCYEYHFWHQQARDLGGLELAREISADIKGLTRHGLKGIVEDGSQRSAFPTGFPFYVYAATLFDAEADLGRLEEEYFSAAFGEDWRQVVAYLGEFADPDFVRFFNKTISPSSEEGKAVCARLLAKRDVVTAFLPVIREHLSSYCHAASTSWRLLEWQARHCLLLFDLLQSEKKEEAYLRWKQEMYPLQYQYENCYDHPLFAYFLKLFIR